MRRPRVMPKHLNIWNNPIPDFARMRNRETFSSTSSAMGYPQIALIFDAPQGLQLIGNGIQAQFQQRFPGRIAPVSLSHPLT
jgi:hypothetical protein